MRILYLSFSNISHSVNAVYIKGLRENGAEVRAYHSSGGRLRKYRDVLRYYFRNRRGADAVVIGYDSPGLVIFLSSVVSQPLVYNALCSVYERLILSRRLAGRFSLKAGLYWFLDFAASHFADLVMLESRHQIEFYRKFFWVRRGKCFLAYTGVDEDDFFYDPATRKNATFTVIFRGRLLPEAGAEYMVQAAKLLEAEKINFKILAFGHDLSKIQSLINKLHPTNLEFIEDFLPIANLRELLQKAHLSLGQLSDHERLQRTIPHKVYESLALRVPYLTARNSGIMELLTEGKTCLACDPADADDLAAKILWAKAHPEELVRIAAAGYELYQSRFRPQVLAKGLIDALVGI